MEIFCVEKFSWGYFGFGFAIFLQAVSWAPVAALKAFVFDQFDR